MGGVGVTCVMRPTPDKRNYKSHVSPGKGTGLNKMKRTQSSGPSSLMESRVNVEWTIHCKVNDDRRMIEEWVSCQG